jgi:hypothetical protein
LSQQQLEQQQQQQQQQLSMSQPSSSTLQQHRDALRLQVNPKPSLPQVSLMFVVFSTGIENAREEKAN